MENRMKRPTAYVLVFILRMGFFVTREGHHKAHPQEKKKKENHVTKKSMEDNFLDSKRDPNFCGSLKRFISLHH